MFLRGNVLQVVLVVDLANTAKACTSSSRPWDHLNNKRQYDLVCGDIFKSDTSLGSVVDQTIDLICRSQLSRVDKAWSVILIVEVEFWDKADSTGLSCLLNGRGGSGSEPHFGGQTVAVSEEWFELECVAVVGMAGMARTVLVAVAIAVGLAEAAGTSRRDGRDGLIALFHLISMQIVGEWAFDLLTD